MRLILTLLLGVLWSAATAAETTFVPDGVFRTTSPAVLPAGLKTVGSWVDGDQFQGADASPWQPATAPRVLFVAGYPRAADMMLRVEWRLQDGKIVEVPYRLTNAAERWIPWRIDAPRGAVEVRWVAADRNSGPGGWLGVSDFIEPDGSVRYQHLTVRAFLAFGVVGAVIGLVALGLRGWWARRRSVMFDEATDEAFGSLLTMALLAVLGYLAFWAWFWTPVAGNIVSWACLGPGLALGVLSLARREAHRWSAPLWIATGIGIFYLVLLLSNPGPSFSLTAANRFTWNLPSDNEIPGAFAERLITAQVPKGFLGDWLASDRPPLQVGWILLFWPLLRLLGFDYETASQVASVWLQLSWVPAIWGLGSVLGLSRTARATLLAAIASLGFTLLNTVYVWPKLAAAAFLLGGVGLLLLGERAADDRWARRFVFAGGLFALGWLSHGGAAFALLGLAIFIVRRLRQWRGWVMLGVTFALFATPWLLYQRLYDPPGNRLLKWHLAGAIAPDPRPFLQTVEEQYRAVGWNKALEARRDNFVMQFLGEWHRLFRFESEPSRRYYEASCIVRSSGLYLIGGLAGGLVLAFVPRLRQRIPTGVTLELSLWLVLTWFVWLALMFIPYSASMHQGAYAMPLLFYTLLITGMLLAFGRWTWLVIALQLTYFFATWLPWSADYLKNFAQR